jgi:hypothetical protein
MYSAFEWRVESPGHDELRCVFFLINGTVMLLDLPREEDEQDAKVPRNDFSLRPSEEREVLERIARLVRTIATGTAMWSAQFEREQGKESKGSQNGVGAMKLKLSCRATPIPQDWLQQVRLRDSPIHTIQAEIQSFSC